MATCWVLCSVSALFPPLDRRKIIAQRKILDNVAELLEALYLPSFRFSGRAEPTSRESPPNKTWCVLKAIDF